jgi:diguanylate cyclase (GGDEF)-like protein
VVGETPRARALAGADRDGGAVELLSWDQLPEPSERRRTALAILVQANRSLDRHASRVRALREAWPEVAFFGFSLRKGGRGPERSERLDLDGHLEAPLHPPTFTALAESAVERRRLSRWLRQAESRVRDQAARLDLLVETTKAANSLLEPKMVIRFVMERMQRLLGCRAWRVYLVDEEAGGLLLEMAGGEAEEEALPRVELGRGLVGWVARYRNAVRLDGASGDPRVDIEVDGLDGAAPGTLLAAPLVSRGHIIGVVELVDRAGGGFSGLDLEMVRTMTEPAATAIENAILFQKLEERSVTDDLTRLYNARFMDGCLRREIKRARRYGHEVSLLFLDLDGFKGVNDEHGHLAGSATLAEVGKILKATVREIDIVARWGGDEFTIVLPETGPEGASVIAERIRYAIAAHSYLSEMGLDVRISASVGVASYPHHGPEAATLLQAADRAMYSVKESGRDGVALALQPAAAIRG